MEFFILNLLNYDILFLSFSFESPFTNLLGGIIYDN